VSAPETYTITGELEGASLIEALAQLTGLSRRRAKGLLDERRVFVNNKRVWMAKHRVTAGDILAITAGVARAPLMRLGESTATIVVNKPAGMLAVGPASVEEELRREDARLTVVHRLDRETTGCLIVARTPEYFEKLKELFAARRVTKQYRALVWGRLKGGEGRIVSPLDGKPAETRWTVLGTSRFATELSIEIATGRLHQIRRHMAAIGAPVVGDKEYQRGAVRSDRLKAVPRQMLHAAEVAFVDPVSGLPVKVAAPLPEDYLAVRRTLEIEAIP